MKFPFFDFSSQFILSSKLVLQVILTITFSSLALGIGGFVPIVFFVFCVFNFLLLLNHCRSLVFRCKRYCWNGEYASFFDKKLKLMLKETIVTVDECCIVNVLDYGYYDIFCTKGRNQYLILSVPDWALWHHPEIENLGLAFETESNIICVRYVLNRTFQKRAQELFDVW